MTSYNRQLWRHMTASYDVIIISMMFQLEQCDHLSLTHPCELDPLESVLTEQANSDSEGTECGSENGSVEVTYDEENGEGSDPALATSLPVIKVTKHFGSPRFSKNNAFRCLFYYRDYTDTMYNTIIILVDPVYLGLFSI